MKIIGVVPVKENSNRFPNKNISFLRGEPLFYHAIKPLLQSEYVSEVFVPTNSPVVKNYIEKKNKNKIKIIHRGKNISSDEDPLFKVLKFTHHSIDNDYDAMAVIMANCPGHDAEYVDRAIKLFQTTESKEFRSFNKLGIENGFFIFSKEVIESATSVSSYICSLTNNGEEIHFKYELDKLNHEE
jgi:CMP-N-acetylneuraminic acid synthetase